jgi:hypothetical protein
MNFRSLKSFPREAMPPAGRAERNGATGTNSILTTAYLQKNKEVMPDTRRRLKPRRCTLRGVSYPILQYTEVNYV